MAKTATSSKKPPTKGEIYRGIAEKTGLSRKQVAAVFEALTGQISNSLGKKGSGLYTIPGLVKLKVIRKPATKGGVRPNPFKPGEMMEVKPKPARNVVKALALKNLKSMV